MMRINFSGKELLKIREKFQAQFALTNYLNLFFNMDYTPKLLWLMVRYPKGVIKGLVAFLKTKVIDDFAFAFLIYYATQRQRQKK